jgi:excisionase family DNA binding protein
VFELIRTGELRSIKLGRSRRVSADALATYVRRLDNDR